MGEVASCVCPKIVPDNKGIYQGAFLDDVISEEKVNKFEKMSGQKLDIGLKFLALATGLDFPTQEAKVMDKRGGAIFIKIEPWSWKGKDDKSFTLEDIVAGKHDHLLKKFAEGAKKFGKPVFLSFGHEMNVPKDKPFRWYPWQGNPELYKNAWQHVHKIISQEACNVTWVWNPNINEFGELLEYYPGDKYVDWVGADGYNTQDYGAAWKSFPQIFDDTLNQLKTLGKPLMIAEFGSDANTPNDEKVKKPKFLSGSIEAMVKSNIKGYVIFNKDKVEGASKEWAIDTPATQKAYRQAIKKYEASFKNEIQFICGDK